MLSSTNIVNEIQNNQDSLSALNNEFQKWYIHCLENSLNVGPINTKLVILWSDISNKKLNTSTVSYIVRNCLKV